MHAFFLLSAFLALFFSWDSVAQEMGGGFPTPQPIQGMRHMEITQPAEKEVEKAESPVVAEGEKSTEQGADSEDFPKIEKRAPLPLEKTLVKLEELKEWSHLSDVAVAQTPEDVKKIVMLIEENPGEVPPQGLFLAAKALADQKKMEEAALYFFAAQLRMMFDVSRWPPRATKEELEAILKESKKTSDQKTPSANSAPQVKNPHAFLSELGRQIGSPIIKWTIANPDRLDKILADVKAWDESAPYLYLPGYDVGEATPFEQWGKSLPKIRALYFERMGAVSKGLRTVKTP
jgi:hypothetical protein